MASYLSTVADQHSKILDASPGVQILSISCSFWENLAKLYVGAPRGLAPPPRGNPGSTRLCAGYIQDCKLGEGLP